MKITDLKYWIVEGDAWNWTFLKLYTDSQRILAQPAAPIYRLSNVNLFVFI